MAFPNFPYTDFHRLNADWILKTVRTCAQKVKEASETVVTYADRLLQVETDVTLLEGTVSTMNGTLTTTTEKANGAVRFDTTQSLTDVQKTAARDNIGAVAASEIPSVTDAVRVVPQTFTNAQKTQARTNIGAAASSDIPSVSDVVRTSAQSFTAQEKVQARTNIGAASESGLEDVVTATTDLQNAVGLAVMYTAQSPTPTQRTRARANIKAEEETTLTEIQDSVVTITPADKTIYECGDVTSLTIGTTPDHIAFMVIFSCGTTPTNFSAPQNIRGLSDFNPQANTIYEINIYDRRAVWYGWPV